MFHVEPKNNLVNIQVDKTGGLQQCESFFNGVIPRIQFQEIIIVRCMETLNNRRRSSIKIILNQKVVSLNITETEEYIKWGGGGDGWWQYFGPEDPRIFEFNHELYLYYTMTNPHPRKPLRGLEYIKLIDAIANDSRGHFMQPNIFGSDPGSIEKNWLFFNNGTNILALYSLHPYILGEVIGDSFRARIKREYKCMNGLSHVHFSSNAIKVNNHGTVEYMFVFNEKIEDSSHPLSYHPYLAFMQSEPPFDLLRITKGNFKIDIHSDRFQFINSLTVLGKSELFADKGDSILVSGGLDDSKVFAETFPIDHFLNLETKRCGMEYSEWDYFPAVNECKSTLDLGLIVSLLMILILIWSVHKQLSRYKVIQKSRDACKLPS